MSDPLDKATSKAPATLGEGCLSRYDPDALDAEDGTDFPDAARQRSRERSPVDTAACYSLNIGSGDRVPVLRPATTRFDGHLSMSSA